MTPARPSTCVRSKEQGKKCAGDKIDGADVDVEKAVEIFRFGLLDRSHVADAGVVDEDVEGADLRDGRSDRLRIRDVEMQGLRRAEGLGKLFGGVCIDIGDPYEGAGANKLFDGGFADAAGATSH